jgi:hypothetical protein
VSVKTANVGHFAIPTAPAAGTSCTSGAANVFTTTYVQLIASTSAALYITGIFIESATALGGTYDVVQLATGGAGSETIVGQYLIALSTGATIATGYRPIFPPIPVANATRIACKTADSVGAKATLITLECINQSNVVDDGIAVGTVTTVTNQLTGAAIATAIWQDTTAGDFTTALSIGKSVMNGVALGTGLTVNSLTNLPAITANWLTAAGTAADFGTEMAAAIWQDTVAGDFTVAASIGKSVMNGVALGTGLTVNTVTNQLTAAAIATGVWQDATAGDFTVASSIGKALYTGNVVPGGSGGLMISGSNAGTTTLGALTVTGATTHTGATVHTGNVSYADGLTIAAPSTVGRAGLDITGNGAGAAFKLAAGATGKGIAITTTAGDGLSILPTAGHAIVATGQGTTKHGIAATGGATSSDGINATGGGSGNGLTVTGGATGHGLAATGGATSGDGIRSVAATSGSGMTITATGSGQHGLNVSSGLSGVASGIFASGGGNGHGIQVTGSGAGNGLQGTGGASGHGINGAGGVTSGNGINGAATTSGHGINATGVGTTKHGISASGGATSSDGIRATGGGSGSGLNAVGGSTGHGTLSTGGAGATGPFDGIKAVAGTAGADIRGAITGNITGNLSGSVDSVTNAVGSVTGNVGGNVVGSVASVTARVTANADQLAGQTVTAAAGVTFPTSVASPTNITAGVITTVTNLTNAPTVGDFTAAMKTSLNAATPASVVGAVGSVTGSVGSVVGLTASNLDTTISSRLATVGYTAPDNADIATILTRTDVATSTRLATAGYTAPDNASITAIKSQTDQLTFTIAGILDANVKRVRAQDLVGDGSAGNPWRPA